MAAHGFVGLQEPRHDELQHDVVRKQNVRWIPRYSVALLQFDSWPV